MISKVSEITADDVAKYLRLDDYETDEIETYLNIAKNYISNYTRIPVEKKDDDESLDDFADFIVVVYVLCQDMHDNRSMYVNNTNLNKVVQNILDMHSRNYL
jgi:hypothetical protein